MQSSKRRSRTTTKKVLLVWPYFPPDPGAAAARGTAFEKHLRGHFEVHVLTRDNHKFIHYEDASNVTRLSLTSSFLPWVIKGNKIEIQKVISNIKPQIVIISIPDIPLGYTAGEVTYEAKIPFFLDVRDMVITDSKIKKLLLNKLARHLYTYAQKVFVTTDTQKMMTSAIYNIPQEKITVLSNGIDLKEYPLDQGQPKNNDIAFLGSINPERNIPALLDFIKNVLAMRLGTTFAFIGIDRTSPFVNNFLESLKTLPQGNIKLVEEVDHKSALNAAMKSRIGLITLIDDQRFDYQLPVKVYEYMAAGLAIAALAPRIQSTLSRFITNNNVGIVEQTSFELAKRVVGLLENVCQLESYQKNNTMVVKQYDRNSILKKLPKLFSS